MDHTAMARHDSADETDETYTRAQRAALPVRQAYPRRRAPVRMGWPRRASLTGDMFLQELLDAAPDALVVVDDACEVALVNRSAERLLDYKRQELLGQSVGILISE